MKRYYRLSLILLALAVACLSACAAGAEEDTRAILREFGHLGHITANSSAEEGAVAPQPADTPAQADYPQPEDIDLAVQGEKALTLMVYMCGSDLEAEYGAASGDILEMAYSDFDNDQVNVLIFTGGSKRWAIPGIPVQERSVWTVNPDSFYGSLPQLQPGQQFTTAQVLQSTREALQPALVSDISNMGEPQTLAEFLQFAHTYYPAGRYALVLWDHGGGPNMGVCVDRLFSDDLISIDELTTSLQDSPFAQERLEWIGFDACLMGSAEVARQLSPYAHYMIASEETEPGSGWNYEFLEHIHEDATGADTGKRVIDIYMQQFTSDPNYKVTLSCVDLDQMDALSKASGAVFSELNQLLTSETYVDFAKARESGAFFGHADNPQTTLDYDLVDYGSYVSSLSQGSEAARQDLMAALDSAVVYSRSTIDNATGLSIYYPHFSSRYYSRISPTYTALSLSESYNEFLANYVNIQTGASAVDWSSLSTVSHLGNKDVRSVLSLQLSEAQINYLASVQLAVFEREGEGYALVSMVPNVEIEEGALSAEYQHRALFIVDENGEPLSPALPFTALGDNRFSAEVELVAHDADGGEILRQKALLHFSIEDDAGHIAISEVLGYDDVQNSYMQRYDIVLDEFDAIELKREVRVPQAFAGETLMSWSEWTPADETLCVCHTAGGQSLMMLHDKLDHDKLFGGFAIRDFQNNHFISALSALSAYNNRRDDEIVLVYDDSKLVLLSGPLFTMGEQTNAVLSMDVKNISGQEAIVVMENVCLNGQPTDLATEVYGFGEHDGLAVDEEQRLVLWIAADQLAGFPTIESVTFDLALLDPVSEEEIGRLPVEVSMSQSA